MNSSRVLLLLATLQIALALVLYWPSAAQHRNGQTPAPLLKLSDKNVDHIDISDEFGGALALHKSDRWRMPQWYNMPVDSRRVTELMAQLSHRPAGFPVSHSDSAKQRFQLSDSNFRFRLRFAQEERSLDTAFLGSSPGFRYLYARREGRPEIHSLPLSETLVSTSPSHWLDKGLLQSHTLLRIATDFFTLARKPGEDWQSLEGELPPKEQVTALEAAVATLDVLAIVAAAQEQELADLPPEFSLRMVDLVGEFDLNFYRSGQRYFVTSSRLPLYFEISGHMQQRFSAFAALSDAPATPSR